MTVPARKARLGLPPPEYPVGCEAPSPRGSIAGCLRRCNDILATGRRRFLLLAGISVLVRIAYGIFAAHHYVPISDSEQYFQIAKNLSSGHGYSLIYPQLELHPTAFRPPLYPTLLGALFYLVGPSVFVGQALNVVIGTGVVLMTDRLGRRLAGDTVGCAAALLVAVYPPLLANDVVMLSEPLSLFLILAVLVLLLDSRVILAGICVGALVLTRPSAQAFIAVVFLWVLCKLGVRRALTFAAITVFTVLPWMGRNWVELGSPVVVTSNGFTLAAVYSPAARESRSFVDPLFDRSLDSTRLAQFNERTWDSTLRNIALKSIGQHPTYVMDVVARNTALTLEVHPSRNNDAEQLDGRRVNIRYVTLPAFYLITILGAAGLLKLRRMPGAALVGITAVYFTTLNLFTVATPRLRAPLDLACCIGLALLLARTPSKSSRPQAISAEGHRGPMPPAHDHEREDTTTRGAALSPRRSSPASCAVSELYRQIQDSPHNSSASP